MQHVLTNESLIKQLNLGFPPTQSIITYYRQALFNQHQQQFSHLHNQFYKLHYLNSVKYPGYVVFFDARLKVEQS